MVAIGSIVSGVKSNFTMSDDLNSILKNNPEADFGFFDPAISIVLVLVAIAAILMLIFVVINLATDFKGSLKFLGVLIALTVLFFILYSSAEVAGTAKLSELVGKWGMSDNMSKIIGGGVKTAAFATIIALASWAVMEIINLFK